MGGCCRVAPARAAVAVALLLTASVHGQTSSPYDDTVDAPPSREADVRPAVRRNPYVFVEADLPPINLNVTMLRHLAGETAVGISTGALAAWVVHRLQGAALMLSVVGSIGTAAALHLKWVSPEQVRAGVAMATFSPPLFATRPCIVPLFESMRLIASARARRLPHAGRCASPASR